MRIFLASSCPVELNPYAPKMLEEFRAVAAADRVRRHVLTEEPLDSDVIIFFDNHLNPDWRVRAMVEHPLLKQFPQKCMVHEERPAALGLLPGVYVSMPRRFFNPQSQRAWCYFKLPEGIPAHPRGTPEFLYSFRGQLGQRISPAYRLRKSVLSLRDGRALIEPVRGFSLITDHGDPAAQAAMKRRYADTLTEAKYVLCPRGYATSSFRCYEAMRAGRVPVILADEWVPPEGPNWEKFAIFVPEDQVADIPDILRAAEPKWEAMAAGALAAFNEYFAPDVNWHNLMEQFRILRESNPVVDPNLIARRARAVGREQLVSRIWGNAAETAKRLGLKK